jgi:hypothetical protein
MPGSNEDAAVMCCAAVDHDDWRYRTLKKQRRCIGKTSNRLVALLSTGERSAKTQLDEVNLLRAIYLREYWFFKPCRILSRSWLAKLHGCFRQPLLLPLVDRSRRLLWRPN